MTHDSRLTIHDSRSRFTIRDSRSTLLLRSSLRPVDRAVDVGVQRDLFAVEEDAGYVAVHVIGEAECLPSAMTFSPRTASS